MRISPLGKRQQPVQKQRQSRKTKFRQTYFLTFCTLTRKQVVNCEKRRLKKFKLGKFWWIAKRPKMALKEQWFKVAEFDRGSEEPQSTECIETIGH